MLFSNENNPLVFKVTNLKDKYSLQSLIASNGGITRDSGSVDFVLVDPDLSNNPEAVNSVFVTDCIKSNSLLDVDAYRLKNLSSWHSSSNTKNSYSPNDDKIMIDHYVQNGARNSLKVWDLLGNGHSGNSWKNHFNKSDVTALLAKFHPALDIDKLKNNPSPRKVIIQHQPQALISPRFKQQLKDKSDVLFQEPKSKKPSTNTFKGKTKFTPQDDALMLDFYILNGKVNSLKTWTALAAEAPNHPPDGWKNRFNKMASRALRIQEREWIMRKAIKELEKDDNDDQEFDIPVASSSKGKKYDDDDEQEFDPPVASSSKDLKRKKYDDIDSDIERDLKLKFVAGDESEDLIGITRQKGGKGKRIQWDDNDEDFNYDDQEIVKPNKINVARTRDIEEIIKPSKGKAVARTRVVEDEDEIIKPNKGKALARKKATDDEDEINPIKSKAIVRKKFTIDNDEEITPHQSSPPKVSLKNKSNSTSPRVAVKNTSPSSNIQQAKKFESTSRPTARASTGGLEKTRNSDQSLGRHSIAAQRVEPKQNQASNPFNYNAYEPSPLKHDIRIDSNGRKYKVEYIDESPSPQPEITDPIIGIKPIYSPPKKIQRTTQPIPETRVLYPTNQLEKQKQKLHQEFSSDFDRSEIDRIFNQCSNDFALARRYCSVQDIDDLGIREKRLVFSDWDDILVVGDSEERKEIEERKGFEVCEKRRAFLRAN